MAGQVELSGRPRLCRPLPNARRGSRLARIFGLVYSAGMSSVHEIETVVSKLSRQELSAFRDWFPAFDAGARDKQFDEDVASGKLKTLADENYNVLKAGRRSDFGDARLRGLAPRLRGNRGQSKSIGPKPKKNPGARRVRVAVLVPGRAFGLRAWRGRPARNAACAPCSGFVVSSPPETTRGKSRRDARARDR
jgi:hypothetical protein